MYYALLHFDMYGHLRTGANRNASKTLLGVEIHVAEFYYMCITKKNDK